MSESDGSGRGAPDPSRYPESAEAYHDRHRAALEAHDFRGRVDAIWGLIARGADAVPFLSQMLRSRTPEAREDAAGAFGWMAGNDATIVDELIGALEAETDVQAADALIVALGQLRDRRAVETLARIIRADATDGDTRHTAIQSLAQIARRRFDRAADPVHGALTWLDEHGYDGKGDPA